MKEVESNPYLAHMGSGPSKGKEEGDGGEKAVERSQFLQTRGICNQWQQQR